jgi:hypothetical protein
MRPCLAQFSPEQLFLFATGSATLYGVSFVSVWGLGACRT